MGRFATAILTVLTVLALGACGALGRSEGLPPGWAAVLPHAVLAERHCYRTLAEVDCHADPLPGEASRKVGFFDAPLAVHRP